MASAATRIVATNVNSLSQGGAFLVDWELYGTKITPMNLRAKMVMYGFDPSVVNDIDQTKVIKSTGQAWAQGRGNADRFRSEVTQDDDFMYVQILRRGSNGTVVAGTSAKRRTFRPVASLVWNKTELKWEDVVWYVSGKAVEDCSGAVSLCRRACDDARSFHDHNFLRPFIQGEIEKLHGVPFLRRKGGARLLPMVSWHQSQRLRAFVGSVGSSYMAMVKTDATDSGTLAAMRRSAKDSISQEVEDIREELASWRERGTRINTVALSERLDSLENLETRTQLFGAALNMMAGTLLQELDEAKEAAREFLKETLSNR